MGEADVTALYGNTQAYFQQCGCQDVANVLGAWSDAVARQPITLLVRTAELLQWLGIIKNQRTPVRDQAPNSVQVYPKAGGKTVRVFGSDGKAVRDIDYGNQAHSGNDPEVHHWDWTSGQAVRGPGQAPQPGEIPPGV